MLYGRSVCLTAGGILLCWPHPLTSPCLQACLKLPEMETTILEDAVRFHVLVAIKISYPVPSKSATLLYDAVIMEGRPLTRLDRSAEEGDTTRAGEVPDAELVAMGELELVEVMLPAFLLVRESGFFRAALTTGLEETHSRVINYEAADAEGGLHPLACRAASRVYGT
jgi:hypothetical protein